jgi:GNAT superfamily N-acetyltransferase
MDLRPATPDDAPEIVQSAAEGFDGYRAWAPDGWVPPRMTPATLEAVRSRLGGSAWYLIAREGAETAGHVALDSSTREEPAALAPGEIYLAQLFVRSRWQGTGLARRLMGAAIAEAIAREYLALRLWTPAGAARARRFYEREGWRTTGRTHERERSPTGLATVEYTREAARADASPGGAS